jgi:hypothetical protein
MIVIDKVRQYIRSLAKDDKHYKELLDRVWIRYDRRNKECPHPEYETCEGCPKNMLNIKSGE